MTSQQWVALGFALDMAEVSGQLICREFSILTLTLTLAVTPSPNYGPSPSPSPSPSPCPSHDPSTQAGCLHCVDLLWFQYLPLMLLLLCAGKRPPSLLCYDACVVHTQPAVCWRWSDLFGRGLYSPSTMAWCVLRAHKH